MNYKKYILISLSILVIIFIFSLLTISYTIIVTNPPHLSNNKFLIAKITGYSSNPDETDSNPLRMANMKIVHKGAIACPRNLKFGTKVKIDNEIYICEDRTNKRIDGIFDIWFNSKQEAYNWGHKIKIVEIIEKETILK